MSILNLFSHRKRMAEGNRPDVYVYDELAEMLRNQVVHILQSSIGTYVVDRVVQIRGNHNNADWLRIQDAITREHGVLRLGESLDASQNVLNYFLNICDVYKALDVIEVCFMYIDKIARELDQYQLHGRGITQEADEAIAELNERFRRAGVGYLYEGGMIMRVDSELVHSEVVKPALQYLNEPGFEGPREEFLRAHGHYRSGEMEHAITDANNAFESTLKTVCDQRDWSYETGARASNLLKIVRREGLLPNYLDKSFDQLSATLSSGLPQVRNERGAHGQGSTPRTTPDYVGAYALHLAAANILLLAKAHKAMN